MHTSTVRRSLLSFVLLLHAGIAQSHDDNIVKSPDSGNAAVAEMDHGAIIRFDTSQKDIHLVFTGHEFADGGMTIADILKRRGIKASFFCTGDFYRTERFAAIITRIKNEGHYLGSHSDKHLLYAPWERRDSTLVTHDEFVKDLERSYGAMERFGIRRGEAKFFLPPYEWHNDTIAAWTREAGLQLVNFTPGTSSNADYTTPDMKNYLSSDSILARILRYESTRPNGLNGFILLTHIGTDPRRIDKFYSKLDTLIGELMRRGYRFKRF